MVRRIDERVLRVTTRVLTEDGVKSVILKYLYDKNDAIKTIEIYNAVAMVTKVGSYPNFVKTLKILERDGIIASVKPLGNSKSLYWELTDLGKEIVERMLKLEEQCCK